MVVGEKDLERGREKRERERQVGSPSELREAADGVAEWVTQAKVYRLRPQVMY